MSQAKRILISNACPQITNETLIQELHKLQVELMSHILFIRSGPRIPGHDHICYLRRQMYVKSEDVDMIPPKLEIPHDGIVYSVYFLTGKITCHICKEEGHIAKYCKNAEHKEPTNTLLDGNKDYKYGVNLPSQ